MAIEESSLNPTERYKKYINKARAYRVPVAFGATLVLAEESEQNAKTDAVKPDIARSKSPINWRKAISGRQPELAKPKPTDAFYEPSKLLPSPDSPLFDFASQVDDFSGADWGKIEKTVRDGYKKGKYEWLNDPVEALIASQPNSNHGELIYNAFKAAGQISYVTHRFGVDLDERSFDLLESDLMATSTARTAGEILFREQLSQQGYDFPYLKAFLNQEKREAALADTTLMRAQTVRDLAREEFAGLTQSLGKELAQLAFPVVMSVSVFSGSYAVLEITGLTQFMVEVPVSIMNIIVNDSVPFNDLLPSANNQQPGVSPDRPATLPKSDTIIRLYESIFKSLEPLLIHGMNLALSLNLAGSVFNATRKR